MNNMYTFTYIDFQSGNEVTHTINNEVLASEIVRNFKYFLQGVSFHNSSLLSALREVVEELEAESVE